jgi:hypothetical protein
MDETILYENGIPVAIAPDGASRENGSQYWKVPGRGEIRGLRREGIRDAVNPQRAVFEEEFPELF